MSSIFLFKTGNETQELRAYQSPRGLRIEGKRPNTIQIESKEEFDLVGFLRYIEYLKELSLSMSDNS
jgi:hypothetical protein